MLRFTSATRGVLEDEGQVVDVDSDRVRCAGLVRAVRLRVPRRPRPAPGSRARSGGPPLIGGNGPAAGAPPLARVIRQGRRVLDPITAAGVCRLQYLAEGCRASSPLFRPAAQ